MNNWQMRAQAKSATIEINGTIGGGMFEEDGVTAKGFISDLKKLGPVDEIELNIFSGGGSVIEGNAIFTALAQHPAKIIANIDFAASMATIIAMAADEIHMAENAFFMIHNPWSFAIGDAKEMRHTAGLLEKMEASAVTAYLRHAKLSEAEVIGMMNEETWMTAQEALDFGFIDGITAAVSIAAAVDVEDLSKAPEAAKAFLVIPEPEPVAETVDKAQSELDAKAAYDEGHTVGLAEANKLAEKLSAEAVAKAEAAGTEAETARAEAQANADELKKAESRIDSLNAGFEYNTDASKNAPVAAKDHEFFEVLKQYREDGLTQDQANRKIDQERPELRKSLISQQNPK